ncbi:cupin domain-containing protein [Brevibacillus humidisoli]|uniref:sugar phosphate nucleotidyltransferase n=1 Tax=Brevibacillus humidisoli TaxID=2895522 RepID=UPI001E5547B2|nr:sugar phosphate nucleotidyltransferase [Brevibacillus humidisoli]UFJ42547.1 cupin domain-containing protein [Brevibacillus humidisoli]
MKLVLLSGGSGKRLWPLSSDARPKQFIKRLKNGSDQWESMLQRVWRQLERNDLSEITYISTGEAQVELIHSQLGQQVPLIIEPERRDTFPAIALAASYFNSADGDDLDEVITVMPVDPYVEDQFFDKIKGLEDVIHDSDANLALIGVMPTDPSTKYGYIVPSRETSDRNQPFVNVDCFKEKPSKQEAKLLIRQHALWNCGVFSFRLRYLIQLMEDRGLPTQYDDLKREYQQLPTTSFDYEVVEKAERVVVAPYCGLWKDLGTWNALTEDMQTNLIGNGLVSEECANTHVMNDLDIPITVLGVSNVVVAASPDGILVSDKLASHRVKELVERLERRPMFEERRWGWYRVLDYKTTTEREVLTKRLCIHAGKNISYQYHQMRSEVWTIVAGTGEVALDGHLYQVKPGDVLQIPVGAKHGVKAITELEVIEVQLGTKLVEEDIVRLYLSWEEMKNAFELY